MEVYLDENFFKEVRKDLKRYATDYDMAIKRSKMLEAEERDRIADSESSYEILAQFGAIM